jgi:hypothetical protein
LVGWFATDPAARSILRRAVDELGEGAGTKDEAALKLLTTASAMPEGAAVAVDEGIVPGGGSTLVYLLRTKDKVMPI